MKVINVVSYSPSLSLLSRIVLISFIPTGIYQLVSLDLVCFYPLRQVKIPGLNL